VATAPPIGYNRVMASSQGFHEEVSSLQPATRERHRAIVSLQEELEAIDWYDQRIDATGDGDLAALLTHNRDEEKEHAAMALEWIRRNDKVFDRELREYLFQDGSIVGKETADKA
jgi:ferritin-like protein